jgi:transposase
VGPLTAVACMLTLEDPARLAKSREVGPYGGLVPKQDESGESSPQLGITKTGDIMLRRLLVGSAHYILGPFGEDCDLRRQGMKLAARGGKNAKRRAIVAVARKLAVLLHRLWVTGEVYQPLRQHRAAAETVCRDDRLSRAIGGRAEVSVRAISQAPGKHRGAPRTAEFG